ncbi:SGK3 [Mytilus edulis]|uniref:SGK3 n=1 Tax=Mytilus edulis TaxID=6550 RepID=A0A8S3SLK6_MYTED|nr:SGK3 [Mytilus edulis]
MEEPNISVSLELSVKCKSSVKKNIIQSNLMGIIKYVLPLQVYKVVVNADNKSWFIFRRYNEFYQLHEKIKKLYPDANLRLPGKRLFGNLDPDFIQQRRDGLDEFIQKLVSHPKISQQKHKYCFYVCECHLLQWCYNNCYLCVLICTIMVKFTLAKFFRKSDSTESETVSPEVRSFLSLDNPRNASEPVDTDTFEDSEAMNGKDNNPVNLGPSEKTSVKPSDFEFLKVIGKGSFGKVLLARHKNESKMFAIKVLQKQAIMKRNEVKHIMSERNVLLKNIKHPVLVGLHYSFQTQDKLYFVLDYVNGGEGHVTLTDFGLCKEGIEGMGTTSTFCGTPEYLAPEVLRKQPYDKTVDWWCLGAVLYEMMYGLPPFYSRDTAEMYDNILYKPLRLRTNVSSAARSILEGLLQKEKEQRLGAKKDFHEIKTHSFFSDINWDDLDKKKIHPPYNPNVSGQLDLKHFDPEFVREPVPASVGKSAGGGKMVSASVMEADNMFQGFSYVPPAEDAFS